MITVLNRLRQPLVVNVVAEKEEDPTSVHFLAKESIELTKAQFNSPEMKNLINSGDLIVTKME